MGGGVGDGIDGIGAGKTTTIKLLLGLIKPASGAASLFGLDSVRDWVAIQARTGYLPPNGKE